MDNRFFRVDGTNYMFARWNNLKTGNSCIVCTYKRNGEAHSMISVSAWMPENEEEAEELLNADSMDWAGEMTGWLISEGFSPDDKDEYILAD